jgi:hypothetical protein
MSISTWLASLPRSPPQQWLPAHAAAANTNTQNSLTAAVHFNMAGIPAALPASAVVACTCRSK